MNMAPELDFARISPDDATCALHLLAAANHRQWATWQQPVVQAVESNDGQMLRALLACDLPSDITDRLIIDAQTTIMLVRRTVGVFAYEPHLGPVLDRKLAQFMRWVEYATSNANPSDLERWKLQARTPFLKLSGSMQESDYRQAITDLTLVANDGGLVLPEQLAVMPRSSSKQRALMGLHRSGLHGKNVVQDVPGILVCVACHKTRCWTPSDW